MPVSITVLIHCRIDMYHISLLCFYTVCVHSCMCVRVCVCAHVSPSVQEYVKIHCNSGTSDKHAGFAIFDKHLVWQINKGCFHNALLKPFNPSTRKRQKTGLRI